MSQFDDKVRRAIEAEDEYSITSVDEPIFRELRDTFRGRKAWMTIYVFVFTMIFTVLFALCLWKFLTLDPGRAKLEYGLGVLLFALFIAMLKIWYYMLLNRNSVLRELKRVELRLSRVEERLGGDASAR